MSLISHSLTANLKPREAPAKRPDSQGATFQKFMAHIDHLDRNYSPAEKKTLGYDRLVQKEAFSTLSPTQKRAVFKALGFEESEIQKFQRAQAKERLNEIVRAYKSYSTKTNKGGIRYTETEVRQMLNRLNFADEEIRIAKQYIQHKRERKICKLNEKYRRPAPLPPQTISASQLPRSSTIDNLSEIDNASTAHPIVPARSIGQTLLNFFVFVGKVLLFLITGAALLIGMALLALFVWPLVE